jgi:type IV/VI secretion system ImpK/VasF family protein
MICGRKSLCCGDEVQLIDTLIPIVALVREISGASDGGSFAVSLAGEAHGVKTADENDGFVARPGIQIDAPVIAQRLAAMIEEARAAARDHEIPQAEFDQGLFVVLAWADEALLSGDWKRARLWQRHLLQRRYFNTITAGVEFFSILEGLRPDQHALREVLAICLALGFKGRHASGSGSRALDEKRRCVLEQVLEHAGLPAGSGQRLFPDAYRGRFGQRAAGASSRRQLRFAPVRPSREVVFLVGIPLLMLVVMFAAYSSMIENSVDAVLALLK